MNPWFKIRTLLSKSGCCRGTIYVQKFYCSNAVNAGKPSASEKKMEDFFFNQKVQSILKRITGVDYEKIFCRIKQKLKTPKLEFVTVERLKELQDRIRVTAFHKLQMPPVMEVRKSTGEILSKNPELQGYADSKIVFTDVSLDVSSRDRMIVVRELDGTLRTGTWDERFRMNQVFFPLPGRNFYVPKLFESPYLDRLLNDESYVFVLDLACAQFEPDEPYYHEVTSRTYEHISEMKKFDVLRSTRHFGPMAFYFAYKNEVELLVLDMIERQLVQDASDTIQLLHILHSDQKTSLNIDNADDLEIIQDFIQQNSSNQKSSLELSFETYIEQHKIPMKESRS